jgi:hypothetical protein
MTLREAYDKLPEYAEGGLSPQVRLELEQLIRQDSDFAEAARVSFELEEVFRTQEWLEPSPGFTWMVLGQAGLVRLKRPPVWSGVWERTKFWVTFATLLGTFITFQETFYDWGAMALKDIGGWLDSLVGTTVFAVHPIIILGLFAPLLAGGFATCVVTGRCKVSS